MIQATVMLDAVSAGAGHDPLLRPFLDSADDEKARHHLAELLERHASPLVRDVVRGQVPERLGGAADASDVHSGVLLRLTAHLWTLRSSADAAPLESFSGYVAATAHNACHAFFRSRYPHRSRLRNKLRYVLTRGAGLALWSDERQSWLAGLAAWSGRKAAPDAGRRLAEARARTAPGAFADLVRTLVEQAGGPCRLEELAEAVAHVLGVTDDAVSLSEETETSAPLESRLADTRPSQGEQLESRLYLEQLWSEILTLPPHQRTALLLNLRDPNGSGMLALLPLTGIASLAEIAAALGLSEQRLLDLWPRLPVDDEWIAGELAVNRRQVINFRKCARERLARRMRKHEEKDRNPVVARPTFVTPGKQGRPPS
jgi:DNA-directed RNA polymerase specialized sigma24 family protein